MIPTASAEHAGALCPAQESFGPTAPGATAVAHVSLGSGSARRTEHATVGGSHPATRRKEGDAGYAEARSCTCRPDSARLSSSPFIGPLNLAADHGPALRLPLICEVGVVRALSLRGFDVGGHVFDVAGATQAGPSWECSERAKPPLTRTAGGTVHFAGQPLALTTSTEYDGYAV